ncbi:MAG: hypothetical protein ACR9NN_14635 [Nostochopsis sp.]
MAEYRAAKAQELDPETLKVKGYSNTEAEPSMTTVRFQMDKVSSFCLG